MVEKVLAYQCYQVLFKTQAILWLLNNSNSMKSLDQFNDQKIKHLHQILGVNHPNPKAPPSMAQEADSEPAVEEIEVAIESFNMEWV